SPLIDELGRRVLRLACDQVRRWQLEVPGCEDLRVTVNLSTRQLRDPGVVDDVRAVLEATGLPAESLVLEITESAAMTDVDATMDRVHELHALGVRLGVDDFGTGYSSLAYLQRLPLDLLKVAKPFVDDLDGTSTGDAFAGTVVKLGQALGLEVVAEGV